MSLQPCLECARHVRATESACPFCGAAIEAAPSLRMPSERLGRAALFAFGAAMATNVAACSASTTQQLDSGAPVDANNAVVDAGPPDAGQQDTGQQDSGFFPPYGTPAPDAGHDGGLMGAYGAPPPRDGGH